MFIVYILKSESSGKLYTGHTHDLKSRLATHNMGFSQYTKGRGPWKLIYSEEFNTRGEAMKREKFFKSGKGREELKGLINKA